MSVTKSIKNVRLCTHINDYNKILREIQTGDANTLKKYHHDNPDVHWTQIRYDKTGDTVLHIAARLGNVDVIRYILTNYHPNSVDCKNCDTKTALHEAAQFSQCDAAKLLIRAGADVNALKKADWTPLMLACTKINCGDTLKTVEILLENGAVVNYENKDGWTVLHLAAREGDVNIFKLLCEHGLDINRPTKNKRTALHIAALHGKCDILTELIRLNLDLNKSDSCGNTALHEAISGGNLEICEILLRHGCDRNRRNNNGFGALHLAAARGDSNVVRYVVEKLNIDVNDRTRSGLTALHCAARSGQTEAYNLLVECGADEEIKDAFGRTPPQYKQNRS